MPENMTGFQPPGNIKKALIDLTYFDMLPRRSPTFFREEPKKSLPVRALLAQPLHRDHPLDLGGVEDDDAAGLASLDADLGDLAADQLAAIGDQHELVGFLD